MRFLANDEPESLLYTAYGPESAHRDTFVLDRAAWESIHGRTAFTKIPGFMPFRACAL